MRPQGTYFNIFIQQNEFKFKHVICEMAAILSWGDMIKSASSYLRAQFGSKFVLKKQISSQFNDKM